jgi:carbonic anhydrase
MIRRTIVLIPVLAVLLVASGNAQIQTKAAQQVMTPAKALDLLKEGNGRFRDNKPKARDWKAAVEATSKGQYPFATIVSCMDSRTSSELVFDQGLGDIFSVRVAGNVIDTDILGSLEYAMKVAGSKLIVVIGHTHCGAVKGAIDDAKLGNLTALLAEIQPAIVASGPGTTKDDAYVDKVAEANVRQSIKEIREKSPVLAEMLKSGTIGIVGAMYNIDNGRVTFYAD